MVVQQLTVLELLAAEPQYLELMLGRVIQSAQYASLSPYVLPATTCLFAHVCTMGTTHREERLALVEYKQCPVSAHGGVPVEWCAYHWLVQAANLRVPVERLAALVGEGLDRVAASLGTPWDGERRAAQVKGRAVAAPAYATAGLGDGFERWLADAVAVRNAAAA